MERQSSWTRTATVLVALAAGAYLATLLWRLLGFLFDIILMLVLAWIIASIVLRNAAYFHARLRMRRGWSLGLAYMAILVPVLLVVVIILPLAVGQAFQLAGSLPDLVRNGPSLLARVQSLADRMGIQVNLSELYASDWTSQGAAIVGKWLAENAVGIASGTAGVFLKVLLVALMSFYMVVDGGRLSAVFFRIIPQAWHSDARYVFTTTDQTFYRWMRGIMIIASIFGTSTLVVMLVMGVPFAVPMAIIAGILVIVPYVGDVLAISLPVLIALSQGSLLDALIVGVVLVVIDLIIINLIVSPKIIGNAVRLPVLLVMVAILLGTKVAGPVGALLGVPTAALVYAMTIAFADRAQRRTNELLPLEGDGSAPSQHETGDPA